MLCTVQVLKVGQEYGHIQVGLCEYLLLRFYSILTKESNFKVASEEYSVRDSVLRVSLRALLGLTALIIFGI